MCNDHPVVTRRQVLHGAVALAAGAGVLGRPRPPHRRLPLRSPLRPQDLNGANAYSMAMHIHSSWSEQVGSMDGHLAQAELNEVDVLWWTDHDGRFWGRHYRKTVHFTSLTDEPGGPGEGGPWHWTAKTHGPLTEPYGGGIEPAPPRDDPSGGALKVSAQTGSSAGSPATFGYWADSQPAGWNYHDGLGGQTHTISVHLTPGWSRGYLEYLIGTSWHAAAAPSHAFPNGRPAGEYSLSFRFVPGSGPVRYEAQGNLGIITVPISGPGDPAVSLRDYSDGSGWVTCAITACNATGQLWPDLESRDFSVPSITLSAVSTGDPVSGKWGYLRFRRASGQVQFDSQAEMMTGLTAKYPAVTQYQGLEVSSGGTPHINWFGPGITVPDYTGDRKGYWAYMQSQVPVIHAAGGLASWNHPYGPRDLPLKSQAKQDAQLAATVAPMLTAGAFGCDILEVAYYLRNGMDIAHHLGLWDVLSRNAVFLTGNGVTDDHFGIDWATGVHVGGGNNFTTSVWAASIGMSDLQAALSAGRAWCGSLTGFAGPAAALDLLADRSCPMGSVSVSKVPTRQLAITAAGIPRGGSVTVLQGTVDYAGQNALASNARQIRSYPATAFAAGGGQVTLPVDNTQQTYVRTEVLDSAGTIVGVSNPVWLLHKAPPNGIPAPRAV